MKKTAFFFAILCASTYLSAQPLNDITFREIVRDKPVLRYAVPNERDVFWQKSIWRVVDVREKMNLPFVYPNAPFFDIIVKAAQAGDLTLYSAEKDDFSIPLSEEDLNAALFRKDTVSVWADEYNMKLVEIETPFSYESVKRFRIKEVWYFDSETSTLQVRILGIAPMREMYTENGDFMGETPMFWVHYPSARESFARELVFNEGNEAARATWEDLFEMRHFSSYVMKEANVRNNRLQDLYSGVDLLLESDKINRELFDFENDLWGY